jgi:type VI secretion system secreted protein Hcp
MAFDAFLKIDRVPGESFDSQHQDWIKVLAYSHGVLQPTGGRIAGADVGAPVERGEHQDFTITKYIDVATPKLNLHCSNGENMGMAVLELSRTIGNNIIYMRYRFHNTHVKSVTIAGLPDGKEERPVEEIGLSYTKVEWDYTKVGPDHQPAGNVVSSWDLQTNTGG